MRRLATVSTVVFFPEGAYGPTNNCVGIGQVLRERGHRVVFVIEESFAGSLEAQGFEERLMRLGPAPEVEEEPGQFWKDFIRDTAPVFRKPTIEQLSEFIEPTWRALCDGARYVDDRLREIFDEVEPDVIVEDNVVCFPAIHHSGRPWARIVSCNPLEVKDDAIPPVFSGYPAGDRTGWDEFRTEYMRAIADLHGEFSAFVEERGAQPLRDARVHPRVGVAEPVPLSRRGRLRARHAARADVASARHLRSALGRRRRRSRTGSPLARAGSSTSRSAASARRTST